VCELSQQPEFLGKGKMMYVANAAIRRARGSIWTGFLCSNNPLNMYAFMHEKLPKMHVKYAHKSSYQILKLILYYFKTNRSTFKLILCNN
jgi:hypothetical protein